MAITRLGDKPLRGIILAGGRSRRFGTDKALAPVQGVGMLERAIGLLREFDPEPVIITRPDAGYSFPACRIEKDLISDRGPLGGLYTACCLFKEMNLLVLTCDMPKLKLGPLRKLVKAIRRDSEAVIFKSISGLSEPFPGIYSARLSKKIEIFLRANRRSMVDFIRSLARTQILDAKEFSSEFLNVNRLFDLPSLLKPHQILIRDKSAPPRPSFSQ